MEALTREDFDKLLVEIGQPQLGVCCKTHPNAGLNVLYQDGLIRMLCRDCGFECLKARVASALDREAA
jgi:hypothetical protein